VKWNPFEEKNITSDPYKTVIVARLNYQTTDRTIKQEFEKYGLVKSVQLVVDKNGKSRGYAFVEFERREDFVNAYKNAHLRRIDGRRVIVDYEKGRTILLWRPRRLGGGEGTVRLTKQEIQERDRIRNLQHELKENRRRERGDDGKKDRDHHREAHSRSRSRDRKDKKKDKDRERDRDRDRGERAERDKDRDRDR
jgi:U1 small nuclear ribonucleoprotein